MIDYKKIFRSTEIRLAVLKLLSFLPDSIMLPLQYRVKLGRKLNLKDPKRYTEKLQWYKAYYRNPLMHQCVDKYHVRKYVASKGLEHILVPLLGKFNSVDEIDWKSLPNQFILKTTHGGGGLNVVLCTDKDELDIETIKKKLKTSTAPVMKNTGGREWAYYGLKPAIVAEELLINRENPQAGINDYKIFCYGGQAKYIIVDIDRYIGHKRNFYDRQWTNLHVTSDCPASDRDIPKPNNLDEMLDIAEKLADGFPYVRVDLYDVDGRIFFGELTFYPWSGYVQFMPDEFDYEFGEAFILPEAIR